MREYSALTAATLEAIEALTRESPSPEVGDDGSLLSLAANLYSAWSEAVGKSALQADCNQMIAAIAKLKRQRREYDRAQRIHSSVHGVPLNGTFGECLALEEMRPVIEQ